MISRQRANGVTADAQQENQPAAIVHFDRYALRAARSLDRNLRLQRIVEARIERASATLRVFLQQNGTTHAELGVYFVESGEVGIRVTRRPGLNSTQLRLWSPDEQCTPGADPL